MMRLLESAKRIQKWKQMCLLETQTGWTNRGSKQARERRRVWDRQRRHSMSMEEKQLHLAKRRRNYQLRRQRAESAALVSSGIKFESHAENDNLSLAPVPDLSDQFANTDLFQKQKISFSKLEGIHTKSYKSPDNTRRMRLCQIKRLARSLDSFIGKAKPAASCQQDDTDMEKDRLAMNCIKIKAVRLNHIKRLARSLNSPITRASDLAPLSMVPEQQDAAETETGCEKTLN